MVELPRLAPRLTRGRPETLAAHAGRRESRSAPTARSKREHARAPKTRPRRNAPVEIRLDIPADLAGWLHAQAQREKRSMAQIVAHAVAAYRSEGELMEKVLELELGSKRRRSVPISSRAKVAAKRPRPASKKSAS